MLRFNQALDVVAQFTSGWDEIGGKLYIYQYFEAEHDWIFWFDVVDHPTGEEMSELVGALPLSVNKITGFISSVDRERLFDMFNSGNLQKTLISPSFIVSTR